MGGRRGRPSSLPLRQSQGWGRLCESLGFSRVGVMREVGQKFGKLLDVHMLQFIYRESDHTDLGEGQ